jgi:hypothetical protein
MGSGKRRRFLQDPFERDPGDPGKRLEGKQGGYGVGISSSVVLNDKDKGQEVLNGDVSNRKTECVR